MTALALNDWVGELALTNPAGQSLWFYGLFECFLWVFKRIGFLFLSLGRWASFLAILFATGSQRVGLLWRTIILLSNTGSCTAF